MQNRFMAVFGFWFLLFSPYLGLAQAPLPEDLLKAKTAFVMNDGVRAKYFDDFYNRLKKWGRFEIVQDKQKADSIIALSKRQDGFEFSGLPGLSPALQIQNFICTFSGCRIMSNYGPTLLEIG
jgi:hypothetical protein